MKRVRVRGERRRGRRWICGEQRPRRKRTRERVWECVSYGLRRWKSNIVGEGEKGRWWYGGRTSSAAPV